MLVFRCNHTLEGRKLLLEGCHRRVLRGCLRGSLWSCLPCPGCGSWPVGLTIEQYTSAFWLLLAPDASGDVVGGSVPKAVIRTVAEVRFLAADCALEGPGRRGVAWLDGEAVSIFRSSLLCLTSHLRNSILAASQLHTLCPATRVQEPGSKDRIEAAGDGTPSPAACLPRTPNPAREDFRRHGTVQARQPAQRTQEPKQVYSQ